MFDFIKQSLYRYRIRRLAEQLIEHADKDELYEKLLLRLQEPVKEEVVIEVKNNIETNKVDKIESKYDNFGYYQLKNTY